MLTINPNIKKATRKQCFDLSRKMLLEGLDSSAASPRRIEELEAMYKYFMPAIPKKAKDEWSFMARFVAKKDIRYFLQWLYVRNGVMYATNGNIAAAVKSDLPDGYYHPQDKNPVSEDAVFPRIEAMFDSHLTDLSSFKEVKVNRKTLVTEVQRKTEFMRIGDTVGLSIPLLDKATNNAEEFTLRLSDSERSASLIQVPEYPNVKIIIMPMRVLP